MDKYKIILTKQIHSCFAAVSSHDAFLIREEMIPFPPFPGLKVGNHEIVSVTVYSDQSIYCETHADKSYYNVNRPTDNFHKTEGFKDLVEEYLMLDWKHQPTIDLPF